MKLFFCSVLLIAAFNTTFFLEQQLKVVDVEAVERTYNAVKVESRTKVSVSKDFFPGAASFKLDQPIVYKRTQADFPIDLKVEYFYSLPDSTVRLALYDWDFMNTLTIKSVDDLRNVKIKIPFEDFNSKYIKLKQELETKFGVPLETTGETPEKKKENGITYWFRKDKWAKEDCTVELTMTYTTKTNSIGTYRIRSKIYWSK